MQRRGFLGLVGAAIGVRLQADLSSPATPETYGYLTPEIVAARGFNNATVRVFLNGVEVTQCGAKILACDDRAGYIDILATDWSGNWRRDPLDPSRLAKERRHGLVQVTMQRFGASA